MAKTFNPTDRPDDASLQPLGYGDNADDSLNAGGAVREAVDHVSSELDAATDKVASMASQLTDTKPADLIDRMAQAAHQAIDRLAGRAAPIAGRVSEGVAGATEQLQSGKEQARSKTSEWTENMRDSVREKPLASVTIALFVGMLYARLSR